MGGLLRIKNSFICSVLCTATVISVNLATPIDAAWFLNASIEFTEQVSKSYVSSQYRQCKSCGLVLMVSDNSKMSHFYSIKAKDEKELRWEDNCKSCKKLLRNERDKKKSEKGTDLFTCKNILKTKVPNLVAPPELLKSELLEAHKKLPTMVEEKILDNDNSIKEGIINFNKFVSVLLEEYGRQVGASVYVKGKRS